MNNPFVSVITPLFNKDKYLASCIDSVLSQSYVNWEMLIVDDGSTDASQEILDVYAKQHPGKIIPLEHPHRSNRGVSESRQLATNLARGEFLAYLDADDLWRPEKLSHDVEILTKYIDAAAVVSRSLYFWPDGTHPARLDNVSLEYGKVLAPKELFNLFFVKHQIEAPVPCAVTVRRHIALRMSQWDPSFSVAEDLKFFGELFYKYPVFVSKHCLAEYRRLHDGAWSIAMRDGTEEESLKRLSDWIASLQ